LRRSVVGARVDAALANRNGVDVRRYGRVGGDDASHRERDSVDDRCSDREWRRRAGAGIAACIGRLNREHVSGAGRDPAFDERHRPSGRRVSERYEALVDVLAIGESVLARGQADVRPDEQSKANDPGCRSLAAAAYGADVVAAARAIHGPPARGSGLRARRDRREERCKARPGRHARPVRSISILW